MHDARFEPVSNRADWSQPFEIIDDDTNNSITDIAGVSMRIEVREQRSNRPRLVASFDNGKITNLGNGVLEWHFSRSEMTGMCAGTYEIGVTLERDGLTTQYLIGIVPIVDGIVSR